MIRLETTAKILLKVPAAHIEETQIAKMLLEVEKRFNSIEVLYVNRAPIGVRVHISGDMPKYDKGAPKKKWAGKVPERCEGCGDILEGVFIDGKTAFGHWATMCDNCYTTHGVGLGLGKGQKYDLKTLEKIEG